MFEDDFPNFPRWDMLISWRIIIFTTSYNHTVFTSTRFWVPVFNATVGKSPCLLSALFASEA